MRQRSAGFTLLELMIVVTIISILVAIAIPNLLRARMATNQTAAMQVLQNIRTGQETWRRQAKDWVWPHHQLGTPEYADRYYWLHKLPNGDVRGYVDENVARANVTGGCIPRAGYIFMDTDFIIVNNSPVPVDHKVRFGAMASPYEYNLSGITSYYIDSRGTVWEGDLGDNPDTGSGPVDLPGPWPFMFDNPMEAGFRAVTE
jgi:prepilin-type N-terminal cleavage/methylation domain-containing protein